MLERVLQMDKNDQQYYNSAEYKRLSSDEQIDERLDRIMDKLNVIHEDKYLKEGKPYDPYCDKDNPFYDQCLELMNLRCEEIVEYIEKGWSDRKILEQFPDKIPTSQKEFDELSDEQFDRLYRLNDDDEEGVEESKGESYTPEYGDLISDLWKRILCCMAGWAIACVGFAVPSPLFMILLVMAGVIVVEIPCYKILLAGGGIASLFAATIGADTIWVDRSGKEVARENNMGAGAVAGFFVWALTLLVGMFATVFQIFKRFILLMNMQKEQNLKLELKNKPWAPIVSGIAFFILGIICVGIAGSIMEEQTSHVDDFTDEESTIMIEQIVEKMSGVDFYFEDEYHSNNYADKTDAIHVKVEHDGETDSYLVTFSEKSQKDYSLGALQYIRSSDVWYVYDAENKALGAAASANESKELDKFTVEAMMGYDALLANLADVTIRDGYEKVLTFHNEDGATKERLEVQFSDPSVGENAIRILTSPYSFEAQGFNAYVDFIYEDIDFSAYLPAA